ncbi:hypothetical protein DINM_006165 [Dirofilaria immitis]|nr:hypothetical protein [Dirofilaria immitis]
MSSLMRRNQGIQQKAYLVFAYLELQPLKRESKLDYQNKEEDKLVAKDGKRLELDHIQHCETQSEECIGLEMLARNQETIDSVNMELNIGKKLANKEVDKIGKVTEMVEELSELEHIEN